MYMYGDANALTPGAGEDGRVTFKAIHEKPSPLKRVDRLIQSGLGPSSLRTQPPSAFARAVLLLYPKLLALLPLLYIQL